MASTATRRPRLRILVVDDDEIQREVLVSLLESHDYEVGSAPDGVAAFDELRQAPVNIVFTDWMMPRMNGLDLIRQIRHTQFGRYIYVILCTSRISRADLVEGMESGADDYIGKPIHEDELLVRLKAGERVIHLENRLAEDNRKLAEANQSISKAYTRIHEDLEAAARMQRSLLPASRTIHGIQCESLFVPASAVAGDIFNFFPLSGTCTGFYLLDVSGHGIPAAMLSVTLSKALATRPTEVSPLLRVHPGRPGYEILSPNEAIAEVNRRFQDQGDMYFTMVYGVLEEASQCLRLAQAGHPSPILLRGGDPPLALGEGGFPVGVLPEVTYDLMEYSMTKGDRLFLASDGILESASPEGEQFGRARFMEFLASHRDAPLKDLLQALEAKMRRWIQADEFEDDVSLIALELN